MESLLRALVNLAVQIELAWIVCFHQIGNPLPPQRKIVPIWLHNLLSFFYVSQGIWNELFVIVGRRVDDLAVGFIGVVHKFRSISEEKEEVGLSIIKSTVENLEDGILALIGYGLELLFRVCNILSNSKSFHCGSFIATPNPIDLSLRYVLHRKKPLTLDKAVFHLHGIQIRHWLIKILINKNI